MRRMFLFVLAVTGWVYLLWPQVVTGQPLKFGTSTKTTIRHVLAVLAAEEQGFWEKQGLKVEWVASAQARRLYEAMTTGNINIGVAGTTGNMEAYARGVPVIMVSDLEVPDRFSVWVRSDSPVQKHQELKGKKLGITRYGGSIHAYAALAVKELGLQKDIKFVATGDTAPSVAALISGTVDSIVMSYGTMLPLVEGGKVRELLVATDYLPKEWSWLTVLARQDFTRAQPDTIRKVVKAIAQAGGFINKSPRWAIEKMKAVGGLSEQAGKIYYDMIRYYSETGKINPRGMENVRNFLIEYQLVRGKLPPAEDVYTNEFTS